MASTVGAMNHHPARVTVPAGPLQVSVLDYGDPDDPPMVLLHGSSDLAWSLDSIAQAFADRYRVIALDLRGHGHSDHAGAYSILHYVADLDRVLHHFDLVDRRPVLVGHSLGGHIAAQFCGLYPDVPAALVLIEGTGPPARVVSEGPEYRAEFARTVVELLHTPLRQRPLADLDAAVARLVAAHPRLDPGRARFLAEVGTCPGPDGGLVWRFDPRTRDWIASIDHEVTEERWRMVRCPVLAILGTESWDTWWSVRTPLSGDAELPARVRMTPEEYEAHLSAFPDIEHVELSEAGHMIAFDQPERLNDVIAQFLARRT